MDKGRWEEESEDEELLEVEEVDWEEEEELVEEEGEEDIWGLEVEVRELW